MSKEIMKDLKEIVLAILSFPLILIYLLIVMPIFVIIGSIYSVSNYFLREVKKEENKQLRKKILLFLIAILGVSVGLIFYLSPLWFLWFGKR